MKKLITTILIFIILMNTVVNNSRVWAANSTVGQESKEEFQKFNEGKAEITEGNSTNQHTKEKSLGETSSSESVVGGILAFFVRLFPTVVGGLLNIAINSESNNEVSQFTIEDLVLDKIAFFNVNFTDVPEKENLEVYKRIDVNTIIKQNAAKWYGAIRNLSIAILLVVLIIIGILMATNSIASDRAKYKQMLANWFVSFAILMLMPYIMSLAFNICKVTTKTIADMANEWTKHSNIETTLIQGNSEEAKKNASNDDNFEYFEGMASRVSRSGGWQGFSFAFIWALLAFFQIKFFFMYIKRLITIGFLVVISPLITITYSIDKANDNQAQAFKKWMTEFLVNLFIQPLHAILYIIFIYSTYAIMLKAPIIAIIFLWSLSRGETILRRIFKMDKSMSMGRLGKGKK